MAGYFTNKISLESIEACVKLNPSSMIFYSTGSCWWTHNPAHLWKHSIDCLPCDPLGFVLLEAPAMDFIRTAKENPNHYGKHGLHAFVAAHHLNCIVSADDHRSIPFKSWDDYNHILDEFYKNNNVIRKPPTVKVRYFYTWRNKKEPDLIVVEEHAGVTNEDLDREAMRHARERANIEGWWEVA